MLYKMRGKIEEKTMKIAHWNIWGPRHHERIFDFLSNQQVDVACLTEVTTMQKSAPTGNVAHTSSDLNEPASRLDGLELLRERFSGDYHIFYHSPNYDSWQCKKTKEIVHGVGFGSAMLIRKSIEVIEVICTEIDDAADRPDIKPRVIMSAVIRHNDKVRIISHLHGVWIAGNTKGDDPIRDRQSIRIVDELKRLRELYAPMQIVFGGDLNLALETNALAAIEGVGTDFELFNFIRALGVQSTRTTAYRKHGKPGESSHADYVFMWEEAEHWYRLGVHNDENSSDHAPLILETFDLEEGPGIPEHERMLMTL
jgi:exonuclease III